MSDVISDGISKLYDKLGLWLETGIKILPNLLIALFIVLVFWALSLFIFKWSSKLFKRAKFNESLEQLMANIIRIVIFLLGIVFALGVVGLQKTVFSLLAGVGVIGLALGFAFQDLASNFIAGIMLAFRAPIKIGDVIKINGIQGTVVEIRLRDTHVRNFDGQDVFIPNKEFTTNEIVNYSSFGKRKIKIEVGVGYENDASKALEVFEKTLLGLDGILSDPKPAVYAESLGGSSVNLFGFIWFKYPGGDILDLKSKATLAVKRDLEAENFNIPFPIRTLEMSDNVIKSIGKELGARADH